jgi:hypothetical protein
MSSGFFLTPLSISHLSIERPLRDRAHDVAVTHRTNGGRSTRSPRPRVATSAHTLAGDPTKRSFVSDLRGKLDSVPLPARIALYRTTREPRSKAARATLKPYGAAPDHWTRTPPMPIQSNASERARAFCGTTTQLMTYSATRSRLGDASYLPSQLIWESLKFHRGPSEIRGTALGPCWKITQIRIR